MRSQYGKRNHTRFFCYSCFYGFRSKTGEKTREQCINLQEDIRYCETLTPQRVQYPKNSKSEFMNLRKMLRVPVVCYPDLKSTLTQVADIGIASIGIASSTKQQVKYQVHEPASYFTKFVSVDIRISIWKKKKTFNFLNETLTSVQMLPLIFSIT